MAEVSISIPTYNGALYLEECLESAVSQSFVDIEIVIVDDGSTDETFAIAEEFSRRDKRINLFRNKTRLGLVENWNKAIQHSTGEWIKFLFQDDSLTENCIEEMLKAAETTEAGADNKLIIGERNFVIERGVEENLKDFYENSIIALKDIFPGKFRISPEEFSEAILDTGVGVNFVGEPSSVMIRRDACFHHSFFNRNLVHLCDLEYWTRIGTNEGLVYIPERLSDFRVHCLSASAHNHAYKHFQLDRLDKIVLLHDYLFHPSYENLRKIPNSEMTLSNHLENECMNLVGLGGAFDKQDKAMLLQALIEKYPILKKYLDESRIPGTKLATPWNWGPACGG